MRIKNFILFTIALFAVGIITANAQQKNIEFVEYDLPNGLHVILQPDNSTPIVNVSVMYHVGSKNENPNRTGFAHFFEHLMFEGTVNIPRFEYTKYVEKAGGTLNANTNADRTFYYEILPSNQLELGLWLESERMLHARVDSIGIKTQKNVVLEERKQSYENRPYGSFMIEIFKRAFKVHPYQWTTIGAAEHIRAAKDEDFVNFYKTYYVPNNAVLVVAGDINIDVTKKMIEKYYADIPKGTLDMFRPKLDAEPELTKEIRDTIYDNIQLSAIFQAYRVPAVGTPDYYAVSMLNTLLSSGQSSRMYKAIIDEKQKGVQVASFAFGFEHPGLSFIYAFAKLGTDPKEVEDIMQQEIEKVQNELISDREFQKLQNIMENQFVDGAATVSRRAGTLATNYTYYRNTNLINTELSNYLKVTKEDIKRVANKYFTKNNRVVLYYLPKGQKKS